MQSNQGYWCCKDLAITIYLCDASSRADHVHASWHLHAVQIYKLARNAIRHQQGTEIVVVSLEAHSIVGCVCGSLLDNFDWMIHHHIQCMILVAFDAVSSIGLVEEGLLLDALLSCLAIHRPYCRFEGL